MKEFCDLWLAAWTGNQPDVLLSFYDEQAFYLDPARPIGLHGHAEMRPYFEKLLEKNPDWVWSATEIIETEKGFVLKWSAGIPTGSSSIHVEGLDIVEIRDGKITRNEVYFDRTALM